jgi:CRISPR-associated endonuclease Cas1
MNALWITRMAAYKYSAQSVESAKRLIWLKIERKKVLLRRYKRKAGIPDMAAARSIQDVLLTEARAAKSFWREFRELLPPWCEFHGRKPGASDFANRLLDLGYHHVTNIVCKLLEAHEVSPALGLLHVARATNSAPLAYDLVELFRADIVDAEVLRYTRLKKKPLLIVGQHDIAHFLHEINERLERKYYLKDFRACHTYRYYMELQVLKFISAVNHRQTYEPLILPHRHDMRCRRLTGQNDIVDSKPESGSLQ